MNSKPQLEAISIDNLNHDMSVDLIILDKEGNLIRRSMCEQAKIQLNSSNLESGTYFWKVQSANKEIASGKFIVEDN